MAEHTVTRADGEAIAGEAAGELAAAAIAADLEARSWAVAPGFLDSATCATIATEIRALASAGTLTPAGVGRGQSWQVRPEVRADRIHWIDWQHQGSLTAAQLDVWTHLDALRLSLNRTLLLGLRGFEGHVTSYPPGAAYGRHVDNFRGTSGRLVSCVIYLNPGWHPEEGGQLRIYNPSGSLAAEILPTEGTLACFLSAEVEHEVRPATRERLSITGWFLDRIGP
jgi:SM-20-related protein